MRSQAFALALLSLLVGLALGEAFPDVDQDTGLLVHRSIITHGLLLPLILFSLVSALKPAPIRLFVMGLSLGVAVHLSYDLFPRAWQGFALIHVPAVGWMYPLLSWLWIALSIICCLYVAMRLVKNALHGAALPIALVGIFVYAGVDEEKVWGPLLAMIVAAAIGLVAALWRASPEDR
jgi:hypothetical protein